MKPRIIVCGLGQTGYKIYSLLRQQGAAVIGVSDRPLPELGTAPIIVGDLKNPTILIDAGIREADTLVLASNDDALNLAILTQAKLLNPRIRIINRLYNETLGIRLDQTLQDHLTMSVDSLAAPIFSFAALGNKAIGQLNLFNQTWPIHEEIISENHSWLGMKISELWENPSRMLIYYLPARGEMDLVSAVAQGKELEIGDHLIVGTKPNVKNKRGSLLKKAYKAIFNLKKYQDYGGPVLIVILALLIMIIIATLIYECVNFNTSVIDALYFSVGLITGAGGKEEVVEQAPDGIKIFTVMMMIVGAGVVGICYALINDFVLGSRLTQVWDAARIPTRNHYIICGLGGIGMKIVRQLHEQGQELVVIEPDANNRFLHAARSIGVPILHEDARVATTLQAAHLKKAAAIIVVTSNDLVNVEIGLTAKALAPNISAILRTQNSHFAQAVQDVFEFQNVLCPSDLATHSFTAAALGGRILGNGMTDDLLWVALATMITPAHPFCGKTVKIAAVEANFVPLYLERNQKSIHSWDLLETTLQSHDVLYLTMPATGLQRLWRADMPYLTTT